MFSLCFVAVVTANTIYDGDKESEGEEDGVSPEDSRKASHSAAARLEPSAAEKPALTAFLFLSRQEIMVGSLYQAEVPTRLCHYGDNEKGEFCDHVVNWRAMRFVAGMSCMLVHC